MAAPGYVERVYAAVLGKLIGVYLGSPIEAWSYERIMQEIGEIDYYLYERVLGDDTRPRFPGPVVRTDDDITGTLTFVRAVEDHGWRLDLSPQDIAETWLNYIVENRTILWWGGRGNSTEHTAFLNLKGGIPAPRSGSYELNGPVVSQQIGGQIFIDCWGLLAPGDPELAAALARAAASVSHDREAVYAAQVVAALEALAFVESDIDRLYDTVTPLIPADSTIHRLIADVRGWCAAEDDWHGVRARLAQRYGYDRYPGVCHVVPNHGVVTMALLMGRDDFSRSLTVANTAGWDTDCNSATVGCLMGLKNGLAQIDTGPDWRGPVADRLYLPTADPSRGITDAVTEAYRLVNSSRAARGLAPLAPKGGARYHFSLPGSLQGFAGTPGVTLDNVAGVYPGERSLRIAFPDASEVAVTTPTFIPPDSGGDTGYELLASPLVYPGQVLRARVRVDADASAPHEIALLARWYSPSDDIAEAAGPAVRVAPGETHDLAWTVPATSGCPVAAVGISLTRPEGTTGDAYLDLLTWDGEPHVTFDRPASPNGKLGDMWHRAWVDAADHFEPRWPEPFRVVQDRGTGLVAQGTRDWRDYRVSTVVSSTHMKSGGLAVRVQGLRRYYALVVTDRGVVELVRQLHEERSVLATAPFRYNWSIPVSLELVAHGHQLTGSVNGTPVVTSTDPGTGLDGGAVGLVCEEGCLSAEAVHVGGIKS